MGSKCSQDDFNHIIIICWLVYNAGFTYYTQYFSRWGNILLVGQLPMRSPTMLGVAKGDYVSNCAKIIGTSSSSPHGIIMDQLRKAIPGM